MPSVQVRALPCGLVASLLLAIWTAAIFPELVSAQSCDEDGDGYDASQCGGDDCDDTNPNIHPAAPEA